MIEKIVVSAAGKGTRMKDLTKDQPKHLIKVNGHPFLYYLLKNIQGAGFKEIILVVGYKKKGFYDFLKNYPFNIALVDQGEKAGEKYGTAIPIQCVKELVGDKNFVAVAGDNYYSVEDLRKIMIDDSLNYLAGLKHDQPERLGVLVKDQNNYLIKIVEKPKEFISNLINISLYKFTPEVFDKISQIKLSPRGEYEITDAVTLLAKERKVRVVEVANDWLDFGSPSDIIKLSEMLLKNQQKAAI